MSCWLLPSAQGACGALCCRSAAARLGRPSLPVQTLLRLLYLKHRYQLGYQSLCREVADSISWRRFCHIGLDQPVPHPTTLARAGAPRRPPGDRAAQPRAAGKARRRQAAASPQTQDRHDRGGGRHRPSHRRRPARARGPHPRWAGPPRPRARRGHPYPVPRPLPRRRPAALADLPDPAAAHRAGPRPDRPAHRAGRPDHPAHLAQAERIARNARRALGRRPGDGRLQRLVCQLEETTAATHRLLDQTRQRLRGTRVIPDRLISLADPDARPIRKGKPHKPTEFGYTVLLAECERGFITTHHTHKGNPPDAAQLVGAVTQVIAIAGRPPGAVAGDRGFGTAANDTALAALGSTGSGCHARAPPARPDKLTSRPDRSNACATGGWESRPASASSNAPSGYGAPGCAAWPARRPGSGWGSSPTTCSA